MSKTAFLKALDDSLLFTSEQKLLALDIASGLPEESLIVYTQFLNEYNEVDVSLRIELLKKLQTIYDEYVSEIRSSTILSDKKKNEMIDLGKIIMDGLFKGIKEVNG
ncbi:MAG TPA: hypothetical protein PK957_00770 [Candidatus Dojkabacteria bacterium]|nr:hypothetical protein [Candidatus Dojkabacteria bacterium]